MRLFAPLFLSLVLASVAAPAAVAQSFEEGGDPGPRPHADCTVDRMPYGEWEKFTDVEFTGYHRYYWYCPENHPKLTMRRARWETKKQMIHVAYGHMIHVAYGHIYQGAYGYGVRSCKRRSRVKVNCLDYFDAEDHIRCTQRYRVYRDGSDDVRTWFFPNSTHCFFSAKSKY